MATTATTSTSGEEANPHIKFAQSWFFLLQFAPGLGEHGIQLNMLKKGIDIKPFLTDPNSAEIAWQEWVDTNKFQLRRGPFCSGWLRQPVIIEIGDQKFRLSNLLLIADAVKLRAQTSVLSSDASELWLPEGVLMALYNMVACLDKEFDYSPYIQQLQTVVKGVDGVIAQGSDIGGLVSKMSNVFGLGDLSEHLENLDISNLRPDRLLQVMQRFRENPPQSQEDIGELMEEVGLPPELLNSVMGTLQGFGQAPAEGEGKDDDSDEDSPPTTESLI